MSRIIRNYKYDKEDKNAYWSRIYLSHRHELAHVTEYRIDDNDILTLKTYLKIEKYGCNFSNKENLRSLQLYVKMITLEAYTSIEGIESIRKDKDDKDKSIYVIN